ncbi:aldo-keto reductase family 1 member A1 [Diachasma alloeum]|uniref:aldo-keto reductase family 1 member A1 n=1 Tax=Diachasma alloeum TaxID=454923 RepID=UPI00073818CD|nr:aldo-keto reductase family 1 member A1 [Diachasma alloeum]
MGSKIDIELTAGRKMPALGFGTWHASEEEITKAMEEALEAGYRHIDCAPVYLNEAAIGRVLKRWMDAGRVTREELFIVTKLPPTGNRPGGPEKFLKKSLKDLQLEYVDLYLVHTPFAFEEVGDELHPTDEEGNFRMDNSTDHIKVWADMEAEVAAGRAKAIGLSNFNIKQIKRVLDHAKVPVANLQIELHAYFQQNDLVKFCKSKGIAVTAYSPLGSRGFVKLMGKTEVIPTIMDNSTILRISEKHEKTPAQIALRFIIQRGIAAIPKSTNGDRMRKNIDIFDFELDEDDMEALRALDQSSNGRVCDFSFIKGACSHPEFPF